ncbi:HTH_Tnp_Tc3_2 domain-containing protein [Trichonephila clavipes]|nr:HTH_Tnp_Tc3_2 domain-containing protein [Trichonephila clavipes]
MREQWTREGTYARKTRSGATRKTTRRGDRRIVRQALVDPTVTRSTLNIGNCVYSGAKPEQCGMPQIGKRLCLVMNPGLFFGQMITVYWCGGALESGTIPPHCSTSHCLHSWCNGAARATIDLLKETFGDRLISRFGPVNWPPRSCDLTPLDYFLWGYVKSLVYADKPQTFDHLENNIRRVIADIRPQMLEKVIENWTSRLDYIRASRGSYMPEIIFKM